jgi:hypothetical protein
LSVASVLLKFGCLAHTPVLRWYTTNRQGACVMRLKCRHRGIHQGQVPCWQGLFAHTVWLDLGFCCVSLGGQGKCAISV